MGIRLPMQLQGLKVSSDGEVLLDSESMFIPDGSSEIFDLGALSLVEALETVARLPKRYPPGFMESGKIVGDVIVLSRDKREWIEFRSYGDVFNYRRAYEGEEESLTEIPRSNAEDYLEEFYQRQERRELGFDRTTPPIPQELKISDEMGQNIEQMQEAVNPREPSVRSRALELARTFPGDRDWKQARNIFEYVRDQVKYISDPRGFEHVQSPRQTMASRAGDCEDQAILLASMWSAVGFRAALVLADTNGDRVPDHAYTAAYIVEAPSYMKIEGGDSSLEHWILADPVCTDCNLGMVPPSNLNLFTLYPTIQQ